MCDCYSQQLLCLHHSHLWNLRYPSETNVLKEEISKEDSHCSGHLQLWDSPLLQNSPLLDIYNQGETCSELVNWIDQGFEALLILSSLVRFTETPLEQSWSCTMTSRYLGFFRDLCLQPWSVTELPQQLNRHHRFWPPAVFSVSFFPWGSLRVIQQNSASPLTTHSLSKTSTTLQQCGQGRGWCPLLPLLVTEEATTFGWKLEISPR